jgi:peptide/nickel transport system substrate-binding protein
MTVREGVTWHDGLPFTAEDVAWSLTRAADQATGNPIQFIWSTLANITASGNTVTRMSRASGRRSSSGCTS